MKVLILSDSHSSLGVMRGAIRMLRPDVIIHLGDFIDDARTIEAENPETSVYYVPGNCDRFRSFGSPETLCLEVGGAKLYMTHGHNHGVKMSIGRLLRDARESGAAAALYGHTHIADCHQEEDGLWVVNPGSCSGGGSVTLMAIRDGKIESCRILSGAAFTL